MAKIIQNLVDGWGFQHTCEAETVTQEGSFICTFLKPQQHIKISYKTKQNDRHKIIELNLQHKITKTRKCEN